ncbi:DMT family transporter [Schlegelella sp. S2-27]|uniref:DMT family transporter n=1 Tax=Caldimonas mangrovi TaxID=2944811 RepID=A0ABT0YKQ1_9BURK|nr:DMT family transporter [Caldimonas mangrovi]MCM5678483.1 DMT family transporter [Caldimonas mangrovi]
MSAVLTPGSGRLWPLYLRLVAVPAIWGGTFIAGRVMALQVPPAVGSVLRYTVACIALLVAARWLEGGLPRLDRRQVLATLGLGATGIFAYNLCFLGALSHLPASRTSLIIALNPVVTIAAGALLLHERLSWRRWLGVAIALAGVWTVISRGQLGASLGQSVGIGEGLMFVGVCAWAAYTLIGRVALKGLTPLAATTYASLWGTAMLAAVALFDLPRLHAEAFTPAVAISALYLGVLGTALAFVWYYQGVQRLGAARTVVFNNLVPVFGACFGVLLLDEPLLPSMLVGGAIAVVGVMLASSQR